MGIVQLQPAYLALTKAREKEDALSVGTIGDRGNAWIWDTVASIYISGTRLTASSFVVDICKPLRPMSDMTNLADQCCRSTPTILATIEESSVTEVTLKDVKILILRDMFCGA